MLFLLSFLVIKIQHSQNIGIYTIDFSSQIFLYGYIFSLNNINNNKKGIKMKKIIASLIVIALSTVSAKALDFSAFELTGGVSANQSVFGASAREKNEDNAGNAFSNKKGSGVFTDSHTGQFIELGIGKYVSFGYEHTPDAISTPVNNRVTNTNASTSVSVDFNDVNTTYVKFNLPFIIDGLYLKSGIVETDMDFKETMASGSTYKNASTEGTMYGGGFAKYLGDTNFAIRVEASYMELDNVKTDNGIASGTASNASGSTTRNEIEATNLEGLTGKIALTYTLGKNN